MPDLLRSFLIVAPATVVVVELFRISPVLGLARGLMAQMRRSMRVVSARDMSEHRKEKVLPLYAFVMLKTSLLLTGWLLALLGVFALALQLGGRIWVEDFNAVLALERVDYAVCAAVVAAAYLSLRRVAGRA